jgi:hypothetical protein
LFYFTDFERTGKEIRRKSWQAGRGSIEDSRRKQIAQRKAEIYQTAINKPIFYFIFLLM